MSNGGPGAFREPVRPLWPVLLGALGGAALGILAILPGGRLAQFAGYAAACLALMMLVAFRFTNRARQMDRDYVPDPRVRWVVLVVAVFGVVGILVNAFRLATSVPT